MGRNRRGLIVDSEEQLMQELNLLQALSYMMAFLPVLAQIADPNGQTITNEHISSSSTDVQTIDNCLSGLKLKAIEPLARSSKEFVALKNYVIDSHEEAHGHLQGAQVETIFALERCV